MGTENYMNKLNPYISKRFERAINLHVIKNLITGFPMPLILGIHGPSGCGKTYQCEHLLRELGAKAFLISGGQLESGTAGEPAKLIRENYIAASQSIQKGETKVAVILINDVDTGLGNWGENVQTTINTQTVYGELMHLVDYPTSVEGRSTIRIPIILTGNDFTKLYEPLVRAGRMTAFEWNPDLEEKTEIISGIFPDIKKDQCSKLVYEFQDQPIAFFSHLHSILKDDILWRNIQRIGASKIIDQIRGGTQPNLNMEVNYEILVQIGKELMQSGKLINHLGK
jgi:SpoVK/Ycf46/Vps4 family AAA+-type ATPase